MLTGIVIAIHLMASCVLIGLVLLHSGKGGGLSDMFGGSVGATALGSAAAERNLDRITVVVALDLRLHHHRARLPPRLRKPMPARRPERAALLIGLALAASVRLHR